MVIACALCHHDEVALSLHTAIGVLALASSFLQSICFMQSTTLSPACCKKASHTQGIAQDCDAAMLQTSCTLASMRLIFLVLLLCLDYVAPMGVSVACIVWCFYGLNYATDCACLCGTYMLASTRYLLGHCVVYRYL
jgi:hypothetical protein